MVLSPPKLSAFQRDVASRFGLVPNFFSSAPDAPEIIERLWVFAKAAYLDNPIPALFKERLFVYLSRFCEVRYCIVRHCAFLVGYGHSSGDPTTPAQSIEQAIRLLRVPPPWQRNSDAVLDALETGPTMAAGLRRKPILKTICSARPRFFSSNRGGLKGLDEPCAMLSAAGGSNICWAFSPLFARHTTGR
jgi:hypothetical protein